MGRKLDKVYEKVLAETVHATNRAIVRDDRWDQGFAQGFAEALRIITSERE